MEGPLESSFYLRELLKWLVFDISSIEFKQQFLLTDLMSSIISFLPRSKRLTYRLYSGCPLESLWSIEGAILVWNLAFRYCAVALPKDHHKGRVAFS